MAWQSIELAPKSIDPVDLPEAQRMMASGLAPVLELRDTTGATALGLWSSLIERWQMTEGYIGEPVEWRAVSATRLERRAQPWPFSDISPPDDWVG